MAIFSEGSVSHNHHTVTSSAGIELTGSQMLVSKVLTYSDVSTEVARTGRIVLPRIQVQQCLPEMLRLCQAEGALAVVRCGGPVKLSVDLVVEDEAGRSWTVLLKTWQNVVSGEHRPTFVLENTADFVRANLLSQGDTLAFCRNHGRMLLRTSLPANELLPRQLKRGAVSAAKRRAATAQQAQPAVAAMAAGTWPVPESAFAAAAAVPPAAARRKRKPAPVPPTTPQRDSAPFWHPQACHAEEAAQALLDMHSGGSLESSLESSLSEQLAAVGSHGISPAAEAAAATLAPAPAAAPCLIYRPQPVHGAIDAAAVLQQQPAADSVVQRLLPPAPPLSGVCQQQRSPHSVTVAASSLPPEALEQAHRWVAAILAQQEKERRYIEQYNRMLLLQALQEQHEQRQLQLHAQSCLAAAAAAHGSGHPAGWLV